MFKHWFRKKKPPKQSDTPPTAKPPPPDVGLESSFELVEFLGRGGSGDTWLYRSRGSGELVAIKLIARPLPKAILPAQVEREIKIQTELGESHFGIINAREAVLTDTHLCLVLEFAAGGSLTSYVSQRWQHAQHTGTFLSEDEARYFFRQFISTVEFCHRHNVAHRDLKLDNTLLDDSQPPVIKICDFGFAKDWTVSANMYTHIGTPVYMSPELIDSRHGLRGYDGKLVDVWASGVMLVAMLLGMFPFDHVDHPDPNTNEAQLEVWLQQVGQQWSVIPRIKESASKLTEECRDLLDHILTIEENKRIGIAQIKEHPWFNKPMPPKFKSAEEELYMRQHQLDARLENRILDEDRRKARYSKLRQMVELAEQRSDWSGLPRTESLMQIDLTDKHVLARPTTDNAARPDLASVLRSHFSTDLFAATTIPEEDASSRGQSPVAAGMDTLAEELPPTKDAKPPAQTADQHRPQ